MREEKRMGKKWMKAPERKFERGAAGGAVAAILAVDDACVSAAVEVVKRHGGSG